MKKQLGILLMSTGLLACGSGSRSPRTNGSISDTLLLKIGISRSFLSTEKRLVSYARPSGRLSIIAPEDAREVWGQDLPGYQDVFALPEAAGAALWNHRNFYVTDGKAAQTFDISGMNRYVQAASSSLAFGFVHESSRAFKIIKLLPDQTWQDEVFEPDWNFSSAEQVELITSFSPNGRQLLAFDIYGLAFDIYKEESGTGRMKMELEKCTSFDSLPVIRTIRWSRDESRIFVGNQSGSIFQLDPRAGCVGADVLTQFELPNSHAILDIQEEKDGQILVSQPRLLTRMDSQNGSITASIPTSCDLPMGALALDSSRLLIACLVPADELDPAKVPLAPRLRDELQYIVHEISSGTERLFVFQDSTVGGLAIDIDSKRLYMMSSSRLGFLETHDLLTGARAIANGILIDGLLDP